MKILKAEQQGTRRERPLTSEGFYENIESRAARYKKRKTIDK